MNAAAIVKQYRMEKQINDPNETEVIDAILNGEAHLYHELVRRHERIAYRMAFSCLKNELDAEDVVQEAILKAYCNLSTFRAEARFRTWLISIVLNEVRSRIRKRGNHRVESIDGLLAAGRTSDLAFLNDSREGPLQALVRIEMRALLRDAVQSLPDSYRSVFILRELKGITTNMTAELLSISISSVKVRLHRARLMLRKHLTPLLKAKNGRNGMPRR